MKLIKVNLEKIKPYENNPRKNNQAVKDVAESIRQCEYIAPIIVDENMVILAGHTRYKALLSLGYVDADVVVKEGLTAEQKRKYRLLDNKTGELAEWDYDLLCEELDGLDFGDLNLDWGVSLDRESVVEDNYEPDPPAIPKSKVGQIYQLGEHRLMCGDSTNLEDVEKLMDGDLADMLLTDPPYNVDYNGKAGKIKNDNMKDDAFREFLRLAFFVARENMKPGAAFHIWHADTEGYNFRGACRDVGLVVRQCLIWVKNSFVLGRQDFQWQHEPCLYGETPSNEEEYESALYGWKDGAAHRWFKNRKQTTILQFDRPISSKEHPTMKPVLLFDYEMQCNSQPGDIVLDLFGGSGTTIMAAEQNKRRARIMELDPRFVDVIIDRWESFTGKKALLLKEG